MTCSVAGCGRFVIARGWCQAHYDRWKTTGSVSAEIPIRVPQTVEERFWAKVVKTETCWLWMAAHTVRGYGTFGVAGRYLLAHRWVYERYRRRIPAGLTIDHLCRVRNCVNPDHLEVVTQQVNILRGNSLSARRARQTECIHGHPFDEANTAYRKNGARTCRTCDRLYHRRKAA